MLPQWTLEVQSGEKWAKARSEDIPSSGMGDDSSAPPACRWLHFNFYPQLLRKIQPHSKRKESLAFQAVL